MASDYDALVGKAEQVMYGHRDGGLTCFDHLPDGHSAYRWCCICGEHNIRESHLKHVARAVLDAVADDLRAEGAEKALLNLPVSLVEFVRSSGRTQWFLARRAQITEKHLSRMLNHGEGRIETWLRVLHAVRADQINPKEGT